jgi:hypothetical protein
LLPRDHTGWLASRVLRVESPASLFCVIAQRRESTLRRFTSR